MPPLITLCHATRQRPVEMLACANLWKERWSGIHAYEQIFSMDVDVGCDANGIFVGFDKDPAYMAYQNRSPRDPAIYKCIVGHPCSSVGAWNRAVCASDPKSAILIQLSDDMHPCKNWDDEIVKAFGGVGRLNYSAMLAVSSPGGSGGDYSGDGVQTIAIMTRARYNEMGYFMYPEFTSTWSDNEVTQAAALWDRLIPAWHLRFEHHWPGEWTDETYKRQNNAYTIHKGPDIFNQRLWALFPAIRYDADDISYQPLNPQEREADLIKRRIAPPGTLVQYMFQIYCNMRYRQQKSWGHIRNLPHPVGTPMEAAFRGDWVATKTLLLPLLRKWQMAKCDAGKFHFQGGVHLWNVADSRLGGKEQLTKRDSTV